MVSPILIKKGDATRFYWNIDANVGAGSPNRNDDVQLVQLAYAIMATRPDTPAGDKAAYALVRPGFPCTGLEADPLVRAIRTHQARRGGTQDGHVSVIAANSGIYPYGAGAVVFMLIALVNTIFDAMPANFPRLDKHKACPPALRASVVKACTL